MPTLSKTLRNFLLAVFLLPLALTAGEERIWQFIPPRAATIDQRMITRKKLITTMLKLDQERKYRFLTQPQLVVRARETVESLINQILLEQLFKKHNINASANEVKKRFYEIYARMTAVQKELLHQKLRNARLTMQEYAEKISTDSDTKFNLALRFLLEQLYPGKLNVSTSRCERFYRENQPRFQTPPCINLSRIFISIPELKKRIKASQPSLKEPQLTEQAEKQAKTKIGNIVNMLLDGDSFSKLASEYSNCPSARNGGLLGSFIRNGGLEKELENIAFKLHPGQISPVIKNNDGYQIIRLNSKIPAGYTPFADVKGFIQEEIQGEIITKLSRKLLKKLRRKHQIKIFF